MHVCSHYYIGATMTYPLPLLFFNAANALRHIFQLTKFAKLAKNVIAFLTVSLFPTHQPNCIAISLETFHEPLRIGKGSLIIWFVITAAYITISGALFTGKINCLQSTGKMNSSISTVNDFRINETAWTEG